MDTYIMKKDLFIRADSQGKGNFFSLYSADIINEAA